MTHLIKFMFRYPFRDVIFPCFVYIFFPFMHCGLQKAILQCIMNFTYSIISRPLVTKIL